MNDFKKSHDLIPFVVVSGTNNIVLPLKKLDPGCIKGCALVFKGGANTGQVRLTLKNDAGTKLIEKLPIEFLAPKDAAFNDSFYPFNFQAESSSLELSIDATANFSSDMVGDLVFFYDRTIKNY
jgi:hypothetical protein